MLTTTARCLLRTVCSPAAVRSNALTLQSRKEAYSVLQHIGRQRFSTVSPILYRSIDNKTSKRKLKVDYNDLNLLIAQDSCLVVDVRSPQQVKNGCIPGSLNIPLCELKAACKMDEEAFYSKYNRPKPPKGNMIALCGSGKCEAATAFEIAYKGGYKKSTQYVGGWEDWLKNENADDDQKAQATN